MQNNGVVPRDHNMCSLLAKLWINMILLVEECLQHVHSVQFKIFCIKKPVLTGISDANKRCWRGLCEFRSSFTHSKLLTKLSVLLTIQFLRNETQYLSNIISLATKVEEQKNSWVLLDSILLIKETTQF